MKLFSTEHTHIGRLYLALGAVAVTCGILLSLIMRIQRVDPNQLWPMWGAIKPEDYLAAVTMHGTLMVFFVLTTVPQAGFASIVLPAQIGSTRMALPWLNAAAFWTTTFSLLVLLSAPFVRGGGPISGWTSYPPFSALADTGPGQSFGMDIWLISIAIFCLAATMSAANTIATILLCRCKGMTWSHLALTAWAWWIAAILTAIVYSVLFLAAILLLSDRHLGTAFFVPAGEVVNGIALNRTGNGSPLLWLHLFWFFGHPEVYIAILPGMGMATMIFANFCKRTVPTYKWMIAALVAIGALGLSVWGHHMFVAGLNPYAGTAFQLTTIAIALPSTFEVFNWIATLWGAKPKLATPMLWMLGFLSLFITGGLSGPLLAQPALDSYLHNTFFVVAHFHLVMAMAGAFSIVAGITYWFPLIAQRRLSERLGKLHFWWTFTFAYLTFLPMHMTGLEGEPRHYAQLIRMPGPTASLLAKTLPLERHITLCALLLALGQVLFIVNVIRTLRRPASTDKNPWQATTLEWAPPSQQPAICYRRPSQFDSAGNALPQWQQE